MASGSLASVFAVDTQYTDKTNRFSPRTAARLSRVHKVSLMLRMVVRNASPHSPSSTTVLSTVTLSH